jgi:hypothetical protein
MQIGDDRGQAEAPLEADPEVDDDQEGGEQQGHRAHVGELRADLRADELDAAQLGRIVLFF